MTFDRAPSAPSFQQAEILRCLCVGWLGLRLSCCVYSPTRQKVFSRRICSLHINTPVCAVLWGGIRCDDCSFCSANICQRQSNSGGRRLGNSECVRIRKEEKKKLLLGKGASVENLNGAQRYRTRKTTAGWTLASWRLFPYAMHCNAAGFEWSIKNALLTRCHHMNTHYWVCWLCSFSLQCEISKDRGGHSSNNRSNYMWWIKNKTGKLKLTFRQPSIVLCGIFCLPSSFSGGLTAFQTDTESWSSCWKWK